MGTSKREPMPPDLVRGQSRFQAWRNQRKSGGRIPEALWTMAARLANAHGVSRTAAALGLDYHRLKKRAGAAAGGSPSGPPTFVELLAPVPVGKQCLFELVNGAGATLRVHLVGYDAADLEALSRGFWSDR